MSVAPDPSTTSVTAIVPCNDLDAAQAWWGRLGFRVGPGGDHGDHRILGDDSGGWVHLTSAPDGWVVPGRNPFGVYVYTPRVDELAVRLRDDILAASKTAEDKPWGMHEFALNGPDDLLVRIGWPIVRLP